MMARGPSILPISTTSPKARTRPAPTPSTPTGAPAGPPSVSSTPSRNRTGPPMRDRPWNLLIFAIDSLRADHMSCYGYRRLTTPYADRLAREGVLFERCYSAYIPTTPAYSTILTGMDVMRHEMVSLTPKGPLDPQIRT